jgi:acetyl-CoA acetyltransferase
MSRGVVIPYRAYWSTPFARWQGAFAHLHSLRFAAHVVREELALRSIEPGVIDFAVLGTTRPERSAFYGVPWLMGLAGAPRVAGPTVSQACATSVRALQTAAREVAAGDSAVALAVACDRTSNGPHLYYPNPAGVGGTGEAEDFILENMACDPLGRRTASRGAVSRRARGRARVPAPLHAAAVPGAERAFRQGAGAHRR